MCVHMCMLCLQLPAEVVLQEQKELFYLQTSPETTPMDRPVSTLYLYPESLVSYTHTHSVVHTCHGIQQDLVWVNTIEE